MCVGRRDTRQRESGSERPSVCACLRAHAQPTPPFRPCHSFFCLTYRPDAASLFSEGRRAGGGTLGCSAGKQMGGPESADPSTQLAGRQSVSAQREREDQPRTMHGCPGNEIHRSIRSRHRPQAERGSPILRICWEAISDGALPGRGDQSLRERRGRGCWTWRGKCGGRANGEGGTDCPPTTPLSIVCPSVVCQAVVARVLPASRRLCSGPPVMSLFSASPFETSCSRLAPPVLVCPHLRFFLASPDFHFPSANNVPVYHGTPPVPLLVR